MQSPAAPRKQPPPSRAGERPGGLHDRRNSVPWLVGLAATDLAARLGAPAALWLATLGAADAALALAAVTSVLAIGRGAVGGLAFERAHRDAWFELVAGVRRLDPVWLRAQFEREGVVLLANGARVTAEYRASELPRVASSLLAWLVVLTAVVVRLGALWLAAGLLVFSVFGGLTALAQRRLRGASERAYARFGENVQGLELLVGAAA
ncbi:MAG: hypothetical protein IT373_01895, partial [Polyangiaceae bacterium]|nr:hypothetical protein [Polyangiaceae bacterium]